MLNSQTDKKDSDIEESDDENDSNDGYLHPLLNRAQSAAPVKPLQTEENTQEKLETTPRYNKLFVKDA